MAFLYPQRYCEDYYGALLMRSLGDQDLESRCLLDNGRHDLTLKHDSPDLGTLQLPLELLEGILKHLDFRTLTRFRRVSKLAMIMVDSVFEYQQIMEKAPQIIRGALSLESTDFTLHDAYVTLKDETCAACGGPGGFVYMITCERACFEGLVNETIWWPLWANQLEPGAWCATVMSRPGSYGLPIEHISVTQHYYLRGAVDGGEQLLGQEALPRDESSVLSPDISEKWP